MGVAKWASIALGVIAVAGTVAYAQYRDIEQPEYELLVFDGAFQLREYSPLIVAEVSHAGERQASLNQGFRRLAAYIFAQDRPGAKDDASDAEEIAMTSPVLLDRESEEIAMTSPVMVEAAGDAEWRTRFVMPGKYTLETLPTPPSDISLSELPSRRVAAVRFNGRGGDESLKDMEALLLEWIAERDLTPIKHAEYAFYDAPMVPPPLRRNEVLIEVAGE